MISEDGDRHASYIDSDIRSQRSSFEPQNRSNDLGALDAVRRVDAPYNKKRDRNSESVCVDK